MILLDTDHLSALKYEESERFAELSSRMLARTDEEFAATVISFEEQMRGWLAVIARWSDPQRQVPAYRELSKLKYADGENPNDQVQEIEEMTTRQIDVLRKIHEEGLEEGREQGDHVRIGEEPPLSILMAAGAGMGSKT